MKQPLHPKGGVALALGVGRGAQPAQGIARVGAGLIWALEREAKVDL
jgi:hypothetical protein